MSLNKIKYCFPRKYSNVRSLDKVYYVGNTFYETLITNDHNIKKYMEAEPCGKGGLLKSIFNESFHLFEFYTFNEMTKEYDLISNDEAFIKIKATFCRRANKIRTKKKKIANSCEKNEDNESPPTADGNTVTTTGVSPPFDEHANKNEIKIETFSSKTYPRFANVLKLSTKITTTAPIAALPGQTQTIAKNTAAIKSGTIEPTSKKPANSRKRKPTKESQPTIKQENSHGPSVDFFSKVKRECVPNASAKTQHQVVENSSLNEASNALLCAAADPAMLETSNPYQVVMLEKIKEIEDKHAKETKALQKIIAALRQECEAREEMSREIEVNHAREVRALQETTAALKQDRSAGWEGRLALKRKIEVMLTRETDEHQLRKNSWKEKKRSLQLLLSLDSSSAAAAEEMLSREKDEYQSSKNIWNEKKRSLQQLLSLDSSSAQKKKSDVVRNASTASAHASRIGEFSSPATGEETKT